MNLKKMKELVDQKKLRIVLSLYRLDNGATIDYDVKMGDRLVSHVCSLGLTEQELTDFFERRCTMISKSY